HREGRRSRPARRRARRRLRVLRELLLRRAGRGCRRRRAHHVRRRRVPERDLHRRVARHAVPSGEEPGSWASHPVEPRRARGAWSGVTGSRLGGGADAGGSRRGPSSFAAVRAFLLAFLVVAVAGRAAAQGPAAVQDATVEPAWSVQTVALRDFREANGVVEQLRGFGLDAYSEFAMND